MDSLDLKIEYSVLAVSVNVSNVGNRDGAQVVQLYIRHETPSICRPFKELMEFSKVHLKADESRQVEIKVPVKYACSYFDEYKNQWICEKGKYHLFVSDISQFQPDDALSTAFEIEESFWWEGI
ncbi:fibronectin type III-like domain-containing protein [Dactylonectria macrodidyma]|uniref:beta-glucosidase n=1 Tax=Dactylonectria macrodidyma TaxID=307937 RepID=A0A9P9DMI1_9HYPO|nr:fibronectin type III-like domain-containing protein [Dactylonectria macrodidyma]